MSKRLWAPLSWAILALVSAPLAFAQGSASLRGTVTDTSGGVVPGATVVLQDNATSFSRESVTDANGDYYFASVSPGQYTVTAKLSGFQTAQLSDVRISSGDTQGRDIQLSVGNLTDVVEVTAERDLIQTETGAREGLITAEQIENLSMIGRSPLELMRLLPGVVAPDQGTMEVVGKSAGASNTTAYSVNGLRGQQIMVTLDGSKLQDVGNNSGALIVPNNDMVSEVKIQTSNYAAEFGTSGTQVQAISKSGSSEFHGSVYYYERNYKLAANDRSRSAAGSPRPESEFKYPGLNLSGPIVQDKLFFFVGAEWAKQSVDTGAILGITPTAAMRNGDFRSTGDNLSFGPDVNIPGGYPGAGDQAPGNNLSPYIDPIGQAMLNLYPAPNYDDGGANRRNYIFSELSDADRNQQILRLDFNASENTKMYLRLARDVDNAQNQRGLWWGSSGVASPSAILYTQVGKAVTFNATSVLSPTTTNEIVVSWSQLKNENKWEDPAAQSGATYGIPNMNPFGNLSPYFPQMVNQFATEGSLWMPQDVDNVFSYNSFFTVSDTFTKVLNTHAIKLGLSVERQDKEQNFQHAANVQFNYAPWGSGSTGNVFGDILVGRPASADYGTPSATGLFVGWNIEGFIQDSWKVSPNFTLEYGVRVGRWTNNAEVNDLGGIFLDEFYDRNAGFFTDSSNQFVNGIAYARLGDVDRNLTDTRPLLVMPRVNFAWDLSGDGSTVVRGGVGVFFNREQGNAQYDVINLPPNSFFANADAGSNTGLGGGQGLNYNTLPTIDPLAGATSFNISTVSPNSLDWPRGTTASLSVAKRIFAQQVFEVGYVGSFGRHLAARQNINVLPAGFFSQGTLGNADLSNPIHRVALTDGAVNGQRVYPSNNEINYLANIGTSDYHSLQVTLSRQAGRLQYLLAYTFAKGLGTVGNDFDPIDPLDPENRSYGVLPNDRTHSANFSWSAQLGDPASGGIGAAVLNGWNLSGVSTYQSGTPIRIGFNQGDLNNADLARAWFGTGDNLGFGGAGNGRITPTYNCDPTIGGSSGTGDTVLDINCIGIPAFGETGPLRPPFYLRSPDRMFHDLTVFKNFRVGSGDKKLQFRIGMFNLFNMAFADPNQNDIDRNIETTCNVQRDGIPNGEGGTADGVCDPQGGFSFTQNTLNNFGDILALRGHRVIELALKFFF